MPLYAATITLSAFLLFMVQPLVARQVLPWFGGSAIVWSTAMVFFQAVLLAGYAWAHGVAVARNPRRAAIAQVALLVAAVATLPVIASAELRPADGERPVERILLLLALTVGLPYLALATTGPLVQAWCARTHPHARVWRLYALSNAASMAALLAYPLLVEPLAGMQAQAWAWSGAFALFALLGAACAWRAARQRTALDASRPPTAPTATTAGAGAGAGAGVGAGGRARAAAAAVVPAPGLPTQLGWLALAAFGSALLLAVTAHLTRNVASVPFLWVLPLALYLGSFVLCFEFPRAWRPAATALLAMGLALLMLGALGWRPDGQGGVERGILPFRQALPLHATGLLVLCVLAHGELYARRPAPAHLTRFYLLVSAGGALGGLSAGVLAPHVFDADHELPLLLLAGIGLGAFTLLRAWRREPRWLRAAAAALGIATLAGGVRAALDWQAALGQASVAMARNEYGTLRVQRIASDADPHGGLRMMHGQILHGEQWHAPAWRRRPTSYYGASSGVGRAIEALRRRDGERAQHLGVVGLGTGTLAAWGRPGDRLRFYELDPQVTAFARRHFTYLADTPADVAIVPGDARLSLEREPPRRFDLLAIDAFSGDAIPVHLLTREAMAAYLRHVEPDGLVAFHVSNRYLSLTPVVAALAESAGLGWVRIVDAPPTGSRLSRSDWVVAGSDRRLLARLGHDAGEEAQATGTRRHWTDDRHNLLEVLR